jgi:carboxymethylenebutenolidase
MVTTTWNQIDTAAQEGMIVETVTLKGANGDSVNAYYARPAGNGPHPGVVLVHHAPGWDELYREFARRFAQHGYATICPDLYSRFGQGHPDEIAGKVRGGGGVPDETVIGDLKSGLDYIRSQSYSNGKVGIIGTCSGGRHAYLTAVTTKAFDAVVNCWGGGSVQQPDQLTPQRPVSPHTLTKDLNCPVLGIFGNDDQNPSPDAVNVLEEELKKNGKQYEFHRYDGAGHAFWYHDRPAYRQEQAMDAWNKVFDFFAKNLA